MNRTKTPRVLLIGIDAAEPSLVKALIDRHELPALREILARSIWGVVRSPADIGSGAVWPTFMTGRSPLDHEIYSILPWEPAAMRLARLTTDRLNPFWHELSREGYAVGVLDVPFAPVTGLAGGIEIAEWGPHDRMRGRTLVSPPSLRDWLARTVGDHPLGRRRIEISGPRDRRALQELAEVCRTGARLRGNLAAKLLVEWRLDLLLAVFPEVHHASHYLWNTLDPPEIASRSARSRRPGMPGSPLVDIYREIDRQIGALIRAAGEDAMVLIFSLHGMRATWGIPAILDPLLRALGLASLKSWPARTWSDRRRWVNSTARRALPAPLLRLYRRASASGHRAPQPYVLLPYDWPRTATFPVPTDQHGWLRVNLKGREAQGIVDSRRYDDVCTRLEEVLRGLRNDRGLPVVTDILRVARNVGRPPDFLPDLIVHWDDAALVSPLRLASPRIAARATGTAFTGQHTPDGFFILRPAAGKPLNPPTSLLAEELHQLVRSSFRA